MLRPQHRRTGLVRGWSVRLTVFAALVVTLAPLGSPASAAPRTPSPSPSVTPSASPSVNPQVAARIQKIQAEYVQTATAYEQAKVAASQLRERAEQTRKAADQAKVAADNERETLRKYVTHLYTGGPLAGHPTLALLLAGPSDAQAFLRAQAVLTTISREQSATVERAITVLNAADALAAQADKEMQTANKNEQDAQARFAAVKKDADALTLDLTKVSAAAAAARQAAQNARNDAVRKQWQTYLDGLTKAGIMFPPAVALADPAHLPDGMTPLLDAARAPIPGVATALMNGIPTTVLPAETVQAVTGALTLLGKPYTDGKAGPDAYDCGGLAKAAWAGAGQSLPATAVEQWARYTPVPLDSKQVGDLLFFADPQAGLNHVGLYLGANLVLTSDPVHYQVGVQDMPAGLYSAVRVTLPSPAAPNPAPAAAGGKRMVCGEDMHAVQTEKVIRYAEAQIGKRYILGTAGPDTFDCSGLTKAAWAQVGVQMDHYTVSQYAAFPQVPAGQERPGDLIFFVGDLSTSPPPSHVALVVDPANKMMIEAPQSDIPVRYISYATRGGIMGFVRPTPAG